MKTHENIADFHAHILPKVDHGSSSIQTSLAQLKLANDFGVSRIIATSHFYPHKHTLSSFLESRNNAANELISNMQDNIPQIKLGAEVLLCEGLDRFDSLQKLCLEGTNYLLLELPFLDFKEEYCFTVERIIDSGIDIILAHADRYPKENIEVIINSGVSKLQLNASSLSTLTRKKHLYSWIDAGYVVALGSDIHGSDSASYKKFSKAKAKLSERLFIIKEKSDKIWDEIAL